VGDADGQSYYATHTLARMITLGKTHLANALSYSACQAGCTVLFTTAVDAINALVTAQSQHRLQTELKR
jgi:DNA replication protein DnaC